MATRIDLVEDVLPISELRLRAAQQISKIQETQRPLVITQYGKAVAVLMEVAQFQKWQDRLTYLEERTVELEKKLAALEKSRKDGGDAVGRQQVSQEKGLNNQEPIGEAGKPVMADEPGESKQ